MAYVDPEKLGLQRGSKRVEDDRVEAVRTFFAKRNNAWATVDEIAAGCNRTLQQTRTTMGVYSGLLKRVMVPFGEGRGRKGLYCLRGIPHPPPPPSINFEEASLGKGQQQPREASGAQSDDDEDGERRGFESRHADSLDMDIARQAGCRVAVHLNNGNVQAAHDVIDKYWQEATRPSKPLSSREILDLPCSELGIPVRECNTLESHGILFFETLNKLDARDLSRMPNVGPMSIKVIRTAIMNWRETYELALLREKLNQWGDDGPDRINQKSEA